MILYYTDKKSIRSRPMSIKTEKHSDGFCISEFKPLTSYALNQALAQWVYDDQDWTQKKIYETEAELNEKYEAAVRETQALHTMTNPNVAGIDVICKNVRGKIEYNVHFAKHYTEDNDSFFELGDEAVSYVSLANCIQEEGLIRALSHALGIQDMSDDTISKHINSIKNSIKVSAGNRVTGMRSLSSLGILLNIE